MKAFDRMWTYLYNGEKLWQRSLFFLLSMPRIVFGMFAAMVLILWDIRSLSQDASDEAIEDADEEWMYP